MDKCTVGVVQMDTQSNKGQNLRKAALLVEEAVAKGAQFVSLPEYFNYLGPEETEFDAAETIPGPTTEHLSQLARRHGIWLHGGSILERVPGQQKMYNTTALFDSSGQIVGKYRKIHLFDIEVDDGPAMQESETRLSGADVVVCDTAFTRVGLSICYDMRFPELYRIMTLRGARVVFVPAEYTLYTGKDHWEPVLRARAIENQIFIIAPAQIGIKPLFQSYGRSVVIDPWGTVLAKAADTECAIVAELDFAFQERVRAQIPCLSNRKPDAYVWP